MYLCIPVVVSEGVVKVYGKRVWDGSERLIVGRIYESCGCEYIGDKTTFWSRRHGFYEFLCVDGLV